MNFNLIIRKLGHDYTNDPFNTIINEYKYSIINEITSYQEIKDIIINETFSSVLSTENYFPLSIRELLTRLNKEGKQAYPKLFTKEEFMFNLNERIIDINKEIDILSIKNNQQLKTGKCLLSNCLYLYEGFLSQYKIECLLDIYYKYNIDPNIRGIY